MREEVQISRRSLFGGTTLAVAAIILDEWWERKAASKKEDRCHDTLSVVVEQLAEHQAREREH